METQPLTLRTGESHEIRLTSRGASGLQLLFSLEPADVLAVRRRDITSQEWENMRLAAGDAIPALFTVQALKPGRATLFFFEKAAPGRGGPEIPVATYEVLVK